MKRLTIPVAVLLAVFATAAGAIAISEASAGKANADPVSCSTTPNAHPCKTPKQWTADFKKLLNQSPKLKRADAQHAASLAAKHYFPSGCPENAVGSGCPFPAPTTHRIDASEVVYFSIQRLKVYRCHEQETTLTWSDIKYVGVKLRTEGFVCSMTYRTYNKGEWTYEGEKFTSEGCQLGSYQLRVVKAPVYVDTLAIIGHDWVVGPDHGYFNPLLRPLPGLHGKKWPKIEVGLLGSVVGQIIEDPSPPAGVGGEIPCS